MNARREDRAGFDPVAAFMNWTPPDSGVRFIIEEPDAPHCELLGELAEHWPALGSEITAALDALAGAMPGAMAETLPGALVGTGPGSCCTVRLSAFASLKHREADVMLWLHGAPGWPALILFWTIGAGSSEPTRLLRYESKPSGRFAQFELCAMTPEAIAAALREAGGPAVGGGK